MLCIAMISAEETELCQIKLAVEDWCKQKGIEAEILAFDNQETLTAYCSSSEIKPDILLADVPKSQTIPVASAKKLQFKIPDCLVIFMITNAEQALGKKEAEGFRSILKEKFPKALEEALDASIEELNDKEEYFEYFFQKKKNIVSCKDILYFESKRRIVEIHVEGEKEPQYFYGRLSGIEKLLEKRKFVRCHQSFIVNTKYIEGFEKNNILLKNSKVTIPISERYEKIVNKKVFWSVR